jgi:hypothetical protein
MSKGVSYRWFLGDPNGVDGASLAKEILNITLFSVSIKITQVNLKEKGNVK